MEKFSTFFVVKTQNKTIEKNIKIIIKKKYDKKCKKIAFFIKNIHFFLIIIIFFNYFSKHFIVQKTGGIKCFFIAK